MPEITNYARSYMNLINAKNANFGLYEAFIIFQID